MPEMTPKAQISPTALALADPAKLLTAAGRKQVSVEILRTDAETIAPAARARLRR